MSTARIIGAAAVLLHMTTASAQTPYPELTIQDVSWMEGTHHYAVSNTILSPATPELPTEIGASADVEFVSATEVRLLPGFHAGGFNSQGQFHARIDQGLGDPADLVIISPAPDGSSPYGSIEDNVVHVHKWEKVEVGLRLPQEYQEAIDMFFRHYYPYNYPPHLPGNQYTNVAVPGNVDPLHDLNPYADDSLQVVIKLTRPDGSQTMRWGYYMKEAEWIGNSTFDSISLNPTSPLNPYHIRFRFAPELEGLWNVELSLKAPYTLTTAGGVLPTIQFSGLQLVCDPPLPDNNGHLRVNEVNRRTMVFEGDPSTDADDLPYFAIGINMADKSRRDTEHPTNRHWAKYYRGDYNEMLSTMEELHEVGGNFMRMFLLRNIFAPEWVNLGVYDAFKTPQVCDISVQNACGNGGWTTDITGDCQFQCWAFDQMLDQARENGIYIQLCIDPYPPIVEYERFLWGAHPYHLHFVEPKRQTVGNPYDLKRFFYSNVDPEDTESPRLHDEGVFYYWKRKYKYIMSRWGWSVNVPIIEPFNEIDQMLSYRDADMVHNPSNPTHPSDPCKFYGGICLENRVDWEYDPDLPPTYNDWLTELIAFVKDPVDMQSPEDSPLGEQHKLFLTGTGSGGTPEPDYLLPCTNPLLDLVDVHQGMFNPQDLKGYSAGVDAFRDALASNGIKKPFNHGEFTHYVYREFNGEDYDLSPFFHNYDKAFHDELWASAFSGKFAAGSSWHWGRVFWWEGSQKAPPPDPNNNFQSNHPVYQFDNRRSEWNRLRVDNSNYWVQNRTAYHNFKPLTDLLNHPSWTTYNLFGGEYKVRQNEDFTDFEAYYLQNGAPGEPSTVAIGWVRNRKASIFNSYYLGSTEQQFFGCTPPNPATSDLLYLPGFVPGGYFVSWFPTRMNSTVLPPDGPISTSFSGTIALDLQNQFGSIENDFLDTLRADYAFIITPEPFVKSLQHLDEPADALDNMGWDFAVFPNPAHGEFVLQFSEDTTRDISILDVSGRLVAKYTNVTGMLVSFPEIRLAQGAYWVLAKQSDRRKAKKLIIN
jgi:hypothetical protein